MSELKYVSLAFSLRKQSVTLGGCTELCKRDLGLVLLDLFSVRLLIIFCGVADVNVANSAFHLQDGQFKNTLQLCKCDLGDRKK